MHIIPYIFTCCLLSAMAFIHHQFFLAAKNAKEREGNWIQTNLNKIFIGTTVKKE